MKRSEILRSVGIIAEFNPLHTGHLFLLNEAKKHGAAVVALSGNFVQRGDVAIVDKRVRVQAALLCGADLVLELPVSYAMSTAQNFALGGVSALDAFGCDSLLFGSECGETDALLSAADILESDAFSARLSAYSATGMTFAAARARAARDAGLRQDVLTGANNNLAVEYIRAAKKIGSDIDFLTVRRRGAAHDAAEPAGNFVSASLLRQKLLCGDFAFCRRYMPEKVFDLFSKAPLADIERLNTAILAVLRTKSLEELQSLPDLSEGIENKLFSAIRLARSTEELYNRIKVKRYTLSRIRRLVLSAFLGIDNSFFLKPAPYVRILGFSKTGEQLLREKAPACPLPVLVRARDATALPDDARRLFEAECRATDLYSLALEKPTPCSGELTAKIIKTE